MFKMKATGKYMPYDQRLKSRARSLRNEMTEAEKKLWFDYLRKHEVNFTRQKPIDHFIVDFYCPRAKLVIEVDGSSHFSEDGAIYDAERTSVLNAYGLEVLRFMNDEVMQDLESVIRKIEKVLERLMN
jgi:very-short-patch-repair endonuclease